MACVGTASLYEAAYDCQETQAQPTSSSSQSVVCECVSDASSSCVLVTDVSSCDYVLDLYPTYLRVNYAITMVCLFLSLCVGCVAALYGYDINNLSSSTQPPPPVTQSDIDMSNAPQYYFDPESGVNITFDDTEKPTATSAQYGPKSSIVIRRDDTFANSSLSVLTPEVVGTSLPVGMITATATATVTDTDGHSFSTDYTSSSQAEPVDSGISSASPVVELTPIHENS